MLILTTFSSQEHFFFLPIRVHGRGSYFGKNTRALQVCITQECDLTIAVLGRKKPLFLELLQKLKQ